MAHHHEHSKQGNIKVAFFLNLGFAILEIAGGIWTNSMAILSDALHDLGDSFSLGVAWYLEKLAAKRPDSKFSYGYGRFSLLGALINSLVLVAGSVVILSQSIPRIFRPEAVNTEGMLIFAVVGIAVNLIAVLRLRKGTSLNEKVVAWHLLEDVLGWGVVLIGSVVMMFANVPVIDPIMSVLITLYVLYNVVRNLVKIWRVFLQGVPGDVSIDEIETKVAQATDALSVYHTHVWSLDGERHLLSMHIVVSDGIDRGGIITVKQKAREAAMDMGMAHVTIEVDFESEVSGQDCVI